MGNLAGCLTFKNPCCILHNNYLHRRCSYAWWNVRIYNIMRLRIHSWHRLISKINNDQAPRHFLAGIWRLSDCHVIINRLYHIASGCDSKHDFLNDNHHCLVNVWNSFICYHPDSWCQKEIEKNKKFMCTSICDLTSWDPSTIYDCVHVVRALHVISIIHISLYDKMYPLPINARILTIINLAMQCI